LQKRGKTGFLNGLDCSATRIAEMLEHVCQFRLQRNLTVAPSIVSALDPVKEAKVKARHTLTAVMIGLTDDILSDVTL
jgi:hypothetical protein